MPEDNKPKATLIKQNRNVEQALAAPVRTEAPAEKKKIVIIMKKPVSVENSDYATPIVYSYKLKVTTGGETIEY